MTEPLVTCTFPNCNGRDGPGLRPFGFLVKRSECKCQSSTPRVPDKPNDAGDDGHA